ncbi:HAD family phosphatase [Maritimibacter sp. DP1N21-5]|uniref:HAD family hydrolase n=1 Tax=Maritimibacter sp. DP1N21-5 TaxID=2836867 RepID=UPI001C46E81C|nr:HAD family phosphatase [Maritimibacter sp. DP1N21-5]MBV7408304.1 HAD family phosphatase [Maritimibacter sp. DP1N21-5]
MSSDTSFDPPKPEAVIFDIGNVLITWTPEVHYDRWIGPDRRRAMFAAVDLHGMNERFDRGEPFRAVVEETAARHPEWREEILMWHDRWLDLTLPVIDHSVRLLRALRQAGHPVFALTNFGVDSFALSESRDRFLTEFDRRYISGHLGVTKPDPSIYQMVEEDCGIAPDRLLFTDDRVDNIAIAKDRGWQTHLFKHPQGWADTLVEAGLLAREQAV